MNPTYVSLLNLVGSGKLDAFECGSHMEAYTKNGDADKMDGKNFHCLTVLEAMEGNLVSAINFFEAILGSEDWELTVRFGSTVEIERRYSPHSWTGYVEGGNEAKCIVITTLEARIFADSRN